MTFTEAAVEVLRRAGKPLHFAEIAELAIKENLLSHVGQDPEVTMGQRLAAMAKREEDRKVVAIAPDGTFALLEWSPPPELIVEPVAPPLSPPETGEPQYRQREREPRAIHAQARRRLAELQAEHEEGSDAAEAERRKQDDKRGGHKRRFPPPAEVIFEALAVRQSGAPLVEIAQQLLQKNLLSEGLVQDPPSLVAALLEDNRRRTEAGRKPAFIVDGERVTLVEFPPPSAVAELAGEKVPGSVQQLASDARKQAARVLRKRLADLDTSAFEQVCSQLLEKLSMRDVRVAKRSKEGPLYLARQRRGVSELRVAVKLVRGGREIGRNDVQELRRDLAHYSAQLGLVLAAGEAAREARSESSAAGQAPIALYTGDALADELIAGRVGVTVQVVELAEVDEAFFAALSRREDRGRDRERDRRDREVEPQRERTADASPQAASELSEGMLAVQAMHMPVDAATLEAAGDQPSVAASMREDVPQLQAEVQTALADVPSLAAATGGELPPEAEARKRGPRREREERPRATSASEQAWGQPAGTLRFAPPPGPTVATPPKRDETVTAPAEPAPDSTPDPGSSEGTQ